eukprot:XP_762924.1 hypothetical protein [Theileria parva strain Muguga]
MKIFLGIKISVKEPIAIELCQSRLKFLFSGDEVGLKLESCNKFYNKCDINCNHCTFVASIITCSLI